MWDNILQDVISGLLVAVIFAVLAFFTRNVIIAFVKRLIPRLASKTPHVNFEIKSHHMKNGDWRNTVTVSNAGDEPAYNVYVFYFEQFPEGNFKLRPSDMEHMISRPVLGVRDSLTFKTAGVHFDGCNVTCVQEIWIEYENSLGVSFRVVSKPGTARGDVARILPPKVIKYRLEQLPGAVVEGGKKDASKYMKGEKTLLQRVTWWSNLKWRLWDRQKFILKNRYGSK